MALAASSLKMAPRILARFKVAVVTPDKTACIPDAYKQWVLKLANEDGKNA